MKAQSFERKESDREDLNEIIDIKTEKDNSTLLTYLDDNTKIYFLKNFYLNVLIQIISNLSILMTIIALTPKIELGSILLAFVTMILIIIIIYLICQFKTSLENNTITVFCLNLVFGFIVSLFFLNIKSYFPHIGFLTSLLLCCIYTLMKKEKRIELSNFIIINLVIGSFVLLLIYVFLAEKLNLFDSLFLLSVHIYFSLCLCYYSYYLINYQENLKPKNHSFYALIFTCELFIFPFTLYNGLNSNNTKKNVIFGFLRIIEK